MDRKFPDWKMSESGLYGREIQVEQNKEWYPRINTNLFFIFYFV